MQLFTGEKVKEEAKGVGIMQYAGKDYIINQSFLRESLIN